MRVAINLNFIYMGWLYRKNVPKNITVHHTGVSYDDNPDQFEATDRYHKSKGWGMIGYHHEIAKDGTIHKGREHHVPGAHCYQEGMNYQSVGIALDGNFDDELPTSAQIASLKHLLKKICADYSIHHTRINPHRKYATYKSCYGSKLPDDWASKLAVEDVPVPISSEEKAKYEGKYLMSPDGQLYAVLKGKKLSLHPNVRLKAFVFQHNLITKVSKDIIDKL